MKKSKLKDRISELQADLAASEKLRLQLSQRIEQLAHKLRRETLQCDLAAKKLGRVVAFNDFAILPQPDFNDLIEKANAPRAALARWEEVCGGE